MQSFENVLRAAAESGYPVHIVLGSNSGSLSKADLENALKITENTSNGSLVVVAYANAEFHPKVVHLARADSSEAAAVGSGNFTGRGLGTNVEAFVTVDTQEGDSPDLLREIAEAIDRWQNVTEAGVFSIMTNADIDALAADGIINLPQPPRPSSPTPAVINPAGNRLGSRRRGWQPQKTISPPAAPPASTGTAQPSPAIQGFTHWCKQMQRSDAQQVPAGTNPTGKLRLTQAGFSIRHGMDFRHKLFGSAQWLPETRGGKTYDVAEVDFDTKINGSSLGILRLKIDHAPHRVAGQGNVSTVLAWGTDIGQLLRAQSYVGYWVVIEHGTDGGFSLVIQVDKPDWAP